MDDDGDAARLGRLPQRLETRMVGVEIADRAMELRDAQAESVEGARHERRDVVVVGMEGRGGNRVLDLRERRRHPFVQRFGDAGLVGVGQGPEPTDAGLALGAHDVVLEHARVREPLRAQLVEEAPDRERETIGHDVAVRIDEHATARCQRLTAAATPPCTPRCAVRGSRAGSRSR
jgi:hypothetical protein